MKANSREMVALDELVNRWLTQAQEAWEDAYFGENLRSKGIGDALYRCAVQLHALLDELTEPEGDLIDELIG